VQLAAVIIGLVADICAAASVVAVFLTIREMRRQRLSSYAPDLFFGDVTVHVGWFWSALVPIRVGSEPITDAHAREQRQGDIPHIRCANLGTGAAKRIQGRWLFDEHAFQQTIKGDDDNSALEPLEPEIRITTRLGRQFRAPVLMGASTRVLIPYVMPSDDPTVEGVTLELPARYVQLSAAVAAIAGDGVFSRAIELPGLSLSVTYEDREGYCHARGYEFACKINCPTVQISERTGIGGTIQLTFSRAKQTTAT